MLKLSIGLIRPGCAQGKYVLKAKGFLLAELRWGNADGVLPEWSPIAFVPIDPAGNGEFFFPGKRAIPVGVTHIWAECVSYDYLRRESIACAIPEKDLPVRRDEAGVSFSVLTDLHLAAKPWMVKRALRTSQSDKILLLGDAVNDGLPEQFAAFLRCIEEAAPEKTILPVPGNHDITHPKLLNSGADGCGYYAAFQQSLLCHAEEKRLHFVHDPDSLAWSLQLGGLDLIGLQCVVNGRQFRFPDGAQLDWLQQQLEVHIDADWHVILCHAPLLKHNPSRKDGNPYLDKNKRLQEMLDRFGNVVFLSGHTHVSSNVLCGGAEQDEKTGNIYLDCGSVVATDTDGDSGLMAPDWKDGCITELVLTHDSVKVIMRSLDSGRMFARGCYVFHKK